MRRRTRTRLRPATHGGPGRPAQKIRRQRLSARAQLEERLWRTARLSKSALDYLLQRRFAEHKPARRERLAERKRPAPNRACVRFSSAPAHRLALRDGARHRHTAHEFAGPGRNAARIFPSKRPASKRGAYAGLLQPHAKYPAGDGANHGTVRERTRYEQNPRSFQFSAPNKRAQDSDW